MSAAAWLEHLTESDLGLLGRVARAAGVEPEQLRRDDEALATVLAHDVTFRAVWGEDHDEALLHASPFLVFATAVHRVGAELAQARHVDEWVGLRQRLPVLGGDDLRDFLAVASRRLFLSALLASYTRVASGSTWVHTSRGWRRRRFSELDPVRLASLLDQVPPIDRPGIFRRLGDLALFLTGVFPDHVARRGLDPIEEGRLLRSVGIDRDAVGDDPTGTPLGAVGFLERLGQRWYELAYRSATRSFAFTVPGADDIAADVAPRFDAARRVLNLVTDRYLLVVRPTWFGEAGG